jgi:hypothetical protein
LIGKTVRSGLRPRSAHVLDSKHPITIGSSATNPKPTSTFRLYDPTPKTPLFPMFIHRGMIAHRRAFCNV